MDLVSGSEKLYSQDLAKIRHGRLPLTGLRMFRGTRRDSAATAGECMNLSS